MKSVLHARAFETAKHNGTIEFGLRYIPGNPLPYFTVTATGRENGRRGAGSDFGGCCHELILEAAPDLSRLSTCTAATRTARRPTLRQTAGTGWPAIWAGLA